MLLKQTTNKHKLHPSTSQNKLNQKDLEIYNLIINENLNEDQTKTQSSNDINSKHNDLRYIIWNYKKNSHKFDYTKEMIMSDFIKKTKGKKSHDKPSYDRNDNYENYEDINKGILV